MPPLKKEQGFEEEVISPPISQDFEEDVVSESDSSFEEELVETEPDHEAIYKSFQDRMKEEKLRAEQAQQIQAQQEEEAKQKDADPRGWSSERFKKEAPKPRSVQELSLIHI